MGGTLYPLEFNRAITCCYSSSERAAEALAANVRYVILIKLANNALMQEARRLPSTKGELWGEMTPCFLDEGKNDGKYE